MAPNLCTLRLRAAYSAQIRAFFAARGVWEVETPILSPAAITDPHLFSLSTQCGSQTLYLHTSPEFPMKRLLAAGSGSIFQIAKVFRAEEHGAQHHPEFTLLEWYRVGFDHHQLMAEVAALVQQLLGDRGRIAGVDTWTYRDLFLHHVSVDPLVAGVPKLAQRAGMLGVPIPPNMPHNDPDPWLDLLLTHCIQPHLARQRLTFVVDYPASQAALARLNPDDPRVAERFELYLGGMELANGFHELSDAVEQRRRFLAENAVRHAQGLPVMPLDEGLLAALAQGLPDCAGVALGMDRLLMCATGAQTIQEVLAFPQR